MVTGVHRGEILYFISSEMSILECISQSLSMGSSHDRVVSDCTCAWKLVELVIDMNKDPRDDMELYRSTIKYSWLYRRQNCVGKTTWKTVCGNVMRMTRMMSVKTFLEYLNQIILLQFSFIKFLFDIYLRIIDDKSPKLSKSKEPF